MHANLRALPNRDIWYRAAHEKYHPGRLTELNKDGVATLILESGEWGIPWIISDIPYGKDKLKHWYFHDPSEEHRILMENLVVIMPPEDSVPSWYVAPPAPKVAVPSAEFVQNVIEGALEETRDKRNGNHAGKEIGRLTAKPK